MESAMALQEQPPRSKPAPKPVPFGSAVRSVPCPRLLAALLCAGLMYLSFYPVACGWLAWVALVPLLCLVRSTARPRNIYFAAWIGGMTFFWPVLQWMRVADYRMYYLWGMLATYCSWYYPLAVLLLRRLDRRTNLPLVITVPAVWVGLEYARSFMLGGFPWYFLGHSQHNFLPLIQVADIAGVYGVSCLVAAASACVFELLCTHGTFRRLLALPEPEPAAQLFAASFVTGRWLPLQGIAVFLLFAGILFYGFSKMDYVDFATGPRIALLQGNVDQRLRNDAALNPGALRRALDEYQHLCSIALREVPAPDLLVWPETSFIPWVSISPELPAEKLPTFWREDVLQTQEVVGSWLKKFPANYLFGVNSFILDKTAHERRYNSALAIKPNGQVAGRYDKIHRLPFGEYMPFNDWLPFLKRFSPYDNDYGIGIGESQTRFKLGDFHYGVLICYEDTDAVLARQLVRGGPDEPAADFIVNMSNESWFDDTCEHEEHLAVCRFRAIECRRTLARSVNTGISAVIDGNGRVLEPRSSWLHAPGKPAEAAEFQAWDITPQNGQVPELPDGKWAEHKKVAGVLTATIPIDRRTSIYAFAGDWLPGLCWLVIGLGIGAPYAPWHKRAGLQAGRRGAVT